MPKRVENIMNASASLNNELSVTETGLSLHYDGVNYNYNGNKPLMVFIDSKGEMGYENKGLEDHFNQVPNNIPNENSGENIKL